MPGPSRQGLAERPDASRTTEIYDPRKGELNVWVCQITRCSLRRCGQPSKVSKTVNSSAENGISILVLIAWVRATSAGILLRQRKLFLGVK
jgi:hypothetical protein